MLQKIINTRSDFTLTLLRLVLGVVFFMHGAQKLLGWFGGYGFSGTMGFFQQQLGIPAPLTLLVMITEFFGGLGVIVGFLSRIPALGIVIDMMVAVCMIHRHFGFFMNWTGAQKGEGFEFHLLAIAVALAILAKGSGAMSIDHFLSDHNP